MMRCSCLTSGATQSWAAARQGLQTLCAIDLAQTLVERSEGKVTGLSRDFQNKAIGEARTWRNTKLL